MEEKNEYLLKILGNLKKTIDDYSDIFIKNHPQIIERETAFGPPREIYELAITAQCLLNVLGEKARDRFEYIGFNLLFPFDNPVDHYNWREIVKNNNIDHTVYLSIMTRIDSEIERFKNFLQMDIFNMYNNLSSSDYLVSKDRYDYIFNKKIKDEIIDDKNMLKATGLESVTKNEITININNEKKGLGLLEKLYKASGLFSNTATLIGKFPFPF